MQENKRLIFKVKKTIRSLYIQLKRFIFSILFGFNTKRYWDALFRSTWDVNGRLQTALFATGFSLIKHDFVIDSVLDYGCGCGDSLPVLRMRFPAAKLYFSDLSDYAMKMAIQNYPDLASPLYFPVNQKFDLVYCSNVIEHIPDTHEFVNDLIRLSNRYIVIQAPYNEYHKDGIVITPENKLDHHVHTITNNFLDRFNDRINWTIYSGKVPYAWDFGEQVYFIGELI